MSVDIIRLGLDVEMAYGERNQAREEVIDVRLKLAQVETLRNIEMLLSAMMEHPSGDFGGALRIMEVK